MSADKHNLRELERITEREAMVIYRRRQGWSQTELARQLRVSMRTLTDWEYGRRGDIPDWRQQVLPLVDHEVVFLYRRRSGQKVSDVARDLGVTPYWVSRMERGREPVHTLLGYWEC